VGLFGLYAVLLGSATLDALDADFPRRDEVLALADPQSPIAVGMGEGGEADDGVNAALATLPARYVALANDRGAKLLMTDLATLERIGPEPGTPIHMIAGLFLPKRLEMLVAHDAQRPGMTALHEFGHFLDHALGDCSFSDRFDELWESANDGTTRRYYLSSTRELFAHYFSAYYFSDRRRRRLTDEHPDAARFFAEIEQGTPRCPR
jgi:Anthrax toxin lethal factor, N- and C-terminal domain